jgi:hypothetical protein
MTSTPKAGSRLVIGLGTGRNGSVSLSRFLSAQRDMTVRHEGFLDEKYHIFRWAGDGDRVRSWIELLDRRARDEGDAYFGDVGTYYLPYVELLIERHPDARFVCLQRDRAKVVKSFLLKTRGTNHWYDHDGTRWTSHKFDACFPSFDEPDKERAIARYWDFYHARIAELMDEYPSQVGLFQASELNERDGRGRILDFIDYRGTRRLDVEFRENRTYLHRRFRWALGRLVGSRMDD